MNAQAISFTFWIRYSFPCTIPRLGNEATDKCKREVFGKYANDEEASGKIGTNTDVEIGLRVLNHQI